MENSLFLLYKSSFHDDLIWSHRRPHTCSWKSSSTQGGTVLGSGLRSAPALLQTVPEAKHLPKSTASCPCQLPLAVALCWGAGRAPWPDAAQASPPGLPCPCHSPFTSQGGGRSTPGKGRAMPNHRVGRGECLHKRCSPAIASVTNKFSIAHVGNYQQVTRWEGTNTALRWAALGWCWVYFYALNKQNQSPRVKARSQLF